MGKLKQSISEEAMDALEEVGETMTYEEWLAEYQPQWVDPEEKIGDLV